MVAAPRQRTLVFVFYILYVITQVTPAESYPVASRWAQVGPPLETGLRSGDLNVFFSDKLFARYALAVCCPKVIGLPNLILCTYATRAQENHLFG